MRRLWAVKEIWANSIGLQISEPAENGMRRFAKPLEFVDVPEYQIVEPMVRVEYQEAQMLMDELWNCGIRPTEGSGSAGSLAATERHLADLQKLVFKQ